MSDLEVIVPSRGRPEAVAELIAALNRTCAATTGITLAVDADDPAHADYASLPAEVLTAENRSMVEALNRAALTVTNGPDAPFAVAFLGDDHRPRTKGWDQAYLDALREMGTGIVYGNDLYQGARIPTQVAMTSDIIRTLGYMAPPDLTHMYVDNAWLALGRAIGAIRYLPDVIVEHLHPVADKADWDEGYERVNAPEVYAHDKAVYDRWVRHSLPLEAMRVRQAALR